MAFITVFTPTYNRAATLERTYKSLCAQSDKDFEWLIIDDGSTDNTTEVVKCWIEQKKIPIKYVKKQNGGLHTGYNKAFEIIDTELNICIDSDDYMPSNGIELIKSEWDKHKNDSELAGLIGLDFTLENKPIGGPFEKTGSFHIYEMTKFHRGDTKIVCRTDIIKKFAPMPVYEGEKNFNPIYYYIQIDQTYKFHLINQNLCFVDYQPSGMSANIYNQYRNSPKSFAQLRRLYMSMEYYPISYHFRNAIHYVSSCMFSKQKDFIKTSPKPFITALAAPLGLLLNVYLRLKTRKK